MASDHGQQAAGHEPAVTSGPPPAAGLEQDFDAGSLYALRSAVAAHAAAAGLAPGRVYEAVAAVHELAANAVRHGAGHGRLRLWTDGQVLTCQVTDKGITPDGQGQHPPAQALPWPAEHAHGLWMVGQVTDQFTIDHGPAGTTATFTLNI